MTPIERLRAADPAAGARLDERAERELAGLLDAALERSAFHRPAGLRRPRGPLLVTALVAAVVIALTAVVLTFVHPRSDVAGPTPAPTLSDVVGPPYRTTGCDPTEALPFECGTYRSTSDGTPGGGAPKKDPLSISFVPQQGVLVITAWWGRCTAASVPVRYENGKLEHVAPVLVGQLAGAGCHAGDEDTSSWAVAFLKGALDHVSAGGALTIRSGTSTVSFDYQGVGELGEKQFPRNDLHCVPVHIAPFACGAYHSVAGTGSMAFLRDHPTTLGFGHANGELTVGLSGWCNALDAVIALDGSTVVTSGVGGDQARCIGSEGAAKLARDEAFTRFFTTPGLTYEIEGRTLTFTSKDGATSATFRRG